MLPNTVESSALKSLEPEFLGRIGARIVHLRRTTSTMDVAHQLIEAADDLNSLHGTAIIADEQTKGRGRFGRKWDSARGEDLLASMILCPRTAIAGRLTTLASLAAAMTVDEITSCRSEIKWPNDVMIDRKKICGVIAESITTGGAFVGVVGIGLNVNRENASGEDRGYISTSIRDVVGSDDAIDRRDVAQVLLRNMNELYDALNRGESIMPEWREKLIGLGSSVEVTIASTQGGEVIAGIAEDVDELGRLLIRESSGTLRAVASGEVTTRINNNDDSRASPCGFLLSQE